MVKRAIQTLAFFSTLLLAPMAYADAILTLQTDNGGVSVQSELSLEDLMALPQQEIITANDYTDGVNVFSGPLLRDVISLTKKNEVKSLTFIAINDYATSAPYEEAEQYDVILALSQNGKALSRRDKGPIWVIYPMSDHAELRDPSFNGRLVWQLAKIEVHG